MAEGIVVGVSDHSEHPFAWWLGHGSERGQGAEQQGEVDGVFDGATALDKSEHRPSRPRPGGYLLELAVPERRDPVAIGGQVVLGGDRVSDQLQLDPGMSERQIGDEVTGGPTLLPERGDGVEELAFCGGDVAVGLMGVGGHGPPSSIG